MKFKQKMLTLCCVPLVLLTVLSLTIGVVQFRSGMYRQTKSSLKSSALAAMNLYNSQGYGNYSMKSDGNVWRGMNFNVSAETSVVDDLKKQTGVDITFFLSGYGSDDIDLQRIEYALDWDAGRGKYPPVYVGAGCTALVP